jgi:hypothetical protein
MLMDVSSRRSARDQRWGRRDVLLAHQPNKRFASVEEVTALCALLATDGAAS